MTNPLNRRVVNDISTAALTAGLGAVAAITPARAHRTILASVNRAESLVRDRRAIRRDEIRSSDELSRALLEHRSRMRELRTETAFCKGYGIYRKGWPADVQVTGLEHVRAAHQEGKGLVIWQMTFLDLTPLFLVMAGAGHPVSHLSTPFHGLASKNELCRRWLGPVLVRSETRDLEERVMMTHAGAGGHLKRLRSIVADEHGTVSIRGDFTHGQRMIEVTHLDRVVEIPTGAPSLAHLTGAPLLTAAVLRRGPLEHEVVIDPAIAVSRDTTRREFATAAVEVFAHRLDERARAHPHSRTVLPFMEVD